MGRYLPHNVVESHQILDPHEARIQRNSGGCVDHVAKSPGLFFQRKRFGVGFQAVHESKCDRSDFGVFANDFRMHSGDDSINNQPFFFGEHQGSYNCPIFLNSRTAGSTIVYDSSSVNESCGVGYCACTRRESSRDAHTATTRFSIALESAKICKISDSFPPDIDRVHQVVILAAFTVMSFEISASAVWRRSDELFLIIAEMSWADIGSVESEEVDLDALVVTANFQFFFQNLLFALDPVWDLLGPGYDLFLKPVEGGKFFWEDYKT